MNTPNPKRVDEMSDRTAEVDRILSSMPFRWSRRWCESSLCFCVGAANCSGRSFGYVTKEEHQKWLGEHRKDNQ